MQKWITLLLLTSMIACTAAPSLVKPGSAAPAAQPLYYPSGDIANTFAWVGQTRESLGIGEEYVDSFGYVRFVCDLFGHDVTGSAYLQTDFSDESRPVRVMRIWLTDDIANMPITEDGLQSRYGAPYATDMEPYVESKGGATYHYRYWTGEGVIALSNGAKNSYYVLEYSVPGEMPEEIAKRLAGLTAEELGHKTGVYFRFADGAIENLHIDETTYEGLPAFSVTFLYQGNACRVSIVPDGKDLFDAIPFDDAWTEHTGLNGVTSQCRIRPDGVGEIVQKNVFGDFWQIETDNPASIDDLFAFELFLLNNWLY